jgi:hypothetical protein
MKGGDVCKIVLNIGFKRKMSSITTLAGLYNLCCANLEVFVDTSLKIPNLPEFSSKLVRDVILSRCSIMVSHDKRDIVHESIVHKLIGHKKFTIEEGDLVDLLRKSFTTITEQDVQKKERLLFGALGSCELHVTCYATELNGSLALKTKEFAFHFDRQTMCCFSKKVGETFEYRKLIYDSEIKRIIMLWLLCHLKGIQDLNIHIWSFLSYLPENVIQKTNDLIQKIHIRKASTI